jgi:thioredoxin reductase (NADPH)
MPDIYDVCIIGGGPSGHSASLYTSRSMLKTILFEGIDNPGGQLTKTTEIENYLGFPEGIDGYELCNNFRRQSEKWGTYIVSEYVERIKREEKENLFSVYFDEMNQYILTKSIIICTGSFARVLKFEGSEKYWNKGITSCAVCHGALPIFRNKPLFVIGGGDTAMEDALYLSRYTNEVYIIHRRDSFKASKVMQQRVFNNNKIKILWNSEIIKAYGDDNNEDMISMISVKNNKSDKITEYKASGVFYAIGHEPCTYFIRNSNININMEKDGYIITENDSTKTNIPGIFCAGDVREKDKKFKQAIVAAGTGCKSALECIEYLEYLEDLEN